VKADVKSGPNRNIAASFGTAIAANAFAHLRDVHHIAQNGPLPEAAAGEQPTQLASGQTDPRVFSDDPTFRQKLMRWIITCNIPLRSVEDGGFRQILGVLAGRVSTCYSDGPLTSRY